MFTGIVQATSRVESLSDRVLLIESPDAFEGDPYVLGESIAVNGCCLTVVESEGGLRFDLSPETLNRTSLGQIVSGGRVNLERAMRVNDRFGGHFVQGHVDATGTFLGARSDGNSTVIHIQAPQTADRYLIDKGSVTVDGISLTVVNPQNGMFEVWIIPQTLKETNLSDRKVGDWVNLEFDVIAKYVEKMVLPHRLATGQIDERSLPTLLGTTELPAGAPTELAMKADQ